MNPPLLAIPGPVEISPGVREAAAASPRGHQDPALIEHFGSTLEQMRLIWKANSSDQPFLIAGSGTLAMDSAVANLIEPGDRVVVVATGYFSHRLAEMLRRAGAEVTLVEAGTGAAPEPSEVAAALARAAALGPVRALCLTHVDTSSGVLIDPQPYAALGRKHGALVIVDGVCAVGGERLEMSDWGLDVVLTGSQKALGLPPGLALLVVSEPALEHRRRRTAPAPPMMLDWLEWLPIQQAYEARQPSYFATPPTSLVAAAAAGLGEIAAIGADTYLEAHRRTALAMRATWAAWGLRPVPGANLEAHTLSNLWLPTGIGDEARRHIAAHGAIVAGGLLPDLRGRSIRVGHMGWSATQPPLTRRIASAVGQGLIAAGATIDLDQGLAAFDRAITPANPLRSP